MFCSVLTRLKFKNVGTLFPYFVNAIILIKTFCFYKYRNEHIEVFKAEILHIPSAKWSSIRIMSSSNDKNNLTYATSHLIGNNQLPFREQLTNLKNSSVDDANFSLSLNPNFERCMLVRNSSCGDYALIKAKWAQELKRKNARTGRQQTIPAHMQCIIYYPLTKQIKRLSIPPTFKFQLESGLGENLMRSKIDLEANSILIDILDSNDESKIRKNSCLEGELAILFSLTVLQVLLQPKENPYSKNGQNQPAALPSKHAPVAPRRTGGLSNGGSSSYNNYYYNNNSNYYIHDWFGYHNLICMNWFLHDYHHHHHHHDHDYHHHNNSSDGNAADSGENWLCPADTNDTTNPDNTNNSDFGTDNNADNDYGSSDYGGSDNNGNDFTVWGDSNTDGDGGGGGGSSDFDIGMGGGYDSIN
jgi:hypothetical protein